MSEYIDYRKTRLHPVIRQEGIPAIAVKYYELEKNSNEIFFPEG